MAQHFDILPLLKVNSPATLYILYVCMCICMFVCLLLKIKLVCFHSAVEVRIIADTFAFGFFLYISLYLKPSYFAYRVVWRMRA